MRIYHAIGVVLIVVTLYMLGYYWYDRNHVQIHPDYYILNKDGTVQLSRQIYCHEEGVLKYYCAIYKPLLNYSHDVKRVQIPLDDATYVRLKQYADDTAAKNDLIGKYNRMEIWEQDGALVVSYRFDKKFIQLYWNGAPRY